MVNVIFLHIIYCTLYLSFSNAPCSITFPLTVVYLLTFSYYTFSEFNLKICSLTIGSHSDKNIYKNNFNVLDEDDTGIPELFDVNNHKTTDKPENSKDEPDYTGIAELFDENSHKNLEDEPDYTGIAELFDENNHENSKDEPDYTGIAKLFDENNHKNSNENNLSELPESYSGQSLGQSESIEWFLLQPVNQPIKIPVDKIPVHNISVPETCQLGLGFRNVPSRASGWLEHHELMIREIRAPLPDGSTVRVLADGPVVLPPYWPDVCETSQHINYPSYRLPPIEIINHFMENGYVYRDGIGFIPDFFKLSDYLVSSLPGVMDFFITMSELNNIF